MSLCFGAIVSGDPYIFNPVPVPASVRRANDDTLAQTAGVIYNRGAQLLSISMGPARKRPQVARTTTTMTKHHTHTTGSSTQSGVNARTPTHANTRRHEHEHALERAIARRAEQSREHPGQG